MDHAEASVPARAALAGNPSDGYGGAVLAVVVPELMARVSVSLAPRLRVDPPAELVAATVRRFCRHYAPAASRSAITWSTSIPQGVGLGGSSAIVIATLRALCCLHRDRGLEPGELADCALAVEVQELGIAAGLQDRVAQAFGGLTFMDFATPRYEPLHPGLLPPLVIAWRERAAGDSDIVHSDLRDRHARAEPAVLEAMRTLRRLAFDARDALLSGDRDAFMRCLDGSLHARASMMSLAPEHTEMVKLARALGAGVNYTGSGGAIVAACHDEEHRQRVAAALREDGCGVLATGAPGSAGARLVLRALAPADAPELERIHREPGVVRWWGEPEDGFPWDEPESTRFTILVDGAIAGLIQYREENEPRYRHAGIDLFLDPALHGQGLGSAAVREVVRRLVHEHGHHRITIDPAVENAAAVRAYEKAGFSRVDVMRRYERGPGGSWRDCVLMELIVEPGRREGVERRSRSARRPGEP